MNGWLKKADDWINVHRPLALLITVALTLSAVWLLNATTGSELFRQFFHPKICDPGKPATCDPLAWKDLLQAAVLTLGLPVAFLLWHWRDRNVRDQIDEQRNQVANARKDINLKEFQEVQQRAAGALDEALPAEARQQLQIAALHQLRGFLRGEYGESFERPAFELLLAGHAAAMERVGLLAELDALRQSEPKPENLAKEIKQVIGEAAKRWTAIDRERAQIIGDEWRVVFNKKWPLRGRRFDAIKLPKDAALGGLDLTRSVFIGAGLSLAHLEGARLSFAHLEGAMLNGAHLEGARLIGARLEDARLIAAHLEGAQLSSASLEGAMLNGAHLEGADLSWIDPASLATFNDAVYDDHTIFSYSIDPRYGGPTADQVRDQWRAKGGRHVDEIQQLG